ncbi:thiamine-phosphate kinase [Virgibacillus profundi]|uniref:Thiamine-monophosphate kinase n=1 Tax=Virgibacillus profundi TaxID=2024555 RepID=A0A2A2I8H8_9BACI|nr:thiamine-phosphate kinase [Virgibacillus profundi]PAV27688.1 thiamine-phosphate kinase [Virgibacillus profundi]PXY51843.1 thiamine-phosphate kinase [Virgibacillus profundi]
MDEFSFIDSIKQNYYRQSTLIKGIGDDAAVLSSSPEDIVTAVDTFVEGVHFTKTSMEPFFVGYRGLAANLSDLAAMGASPAFYLVSIVIPKSWSMEEIAQIFSGMKELAGIYSMDLIGGDTVSGKELSISVTVIGYVKKGKARYRSVAKNGDIVFVTGTLGDSQAGFHILTNPGVYLNESYYARRHQMPSPRVDFAKSLDRLPRVSLNDISDGIASEASEIAEASGVNITLNALKIPVADSYDQFSEDLQHHWKFYGGEDFELMGTIPGSDWAEVQKLADQSQVRITEIGYVTMDHENGNVFLEKNNEKKQLQKRGYNHLK